MNEILASLARGIDKVWDGIDVPFGVLLLGVLMVFLVFRHAHKSGTLDMAEAIRDSAGKISAARILSFGAFLAMFWGLMYDAYANKGVDWKIYVIFGLFWSTSPIAYEIVRKWNGGAPSAPSPAPEAK
jgi:hypothetical protein